MSLVLVTGPAWVAPTPAERRAAALLVKDCHDCGHEKVWHAHGNRTRPCEVPGCRCLHFTLYTQGALL